MNGGSRHRILAITALAGLLMAGCSSSTDAALPSPSIIGPSVSAPAASPSPTPSPSPSVFVPPSPEPVTATYPDGRGPSGDPPKLVDGTWLAGTDMPAGVWRTILDKDLAGCRWNVTDASGAAVETGTTDGINVELRLADGDLLTSEGCVVWNYLGEELAPSAGISVPGLTIFSTDLGKPVAPGTYVVGRDMAPGHYRLVDPESGDCLLKVSYKDKLSSFDTQKFRSSDFTARSVPEFSIDLDRGGVLTSDGCGSWQRFKWSFE